MSSVTFGWESLLNTDVPKGYSLKAALFTTYDRPDERLLVEHLLPFLLNLSREPESEGSERQYFLLELDQRLKRLHDRLVVVSSTAREEPGDSDEGESNMYAWIWRSIRHLTVGRRQKAVQHAKLWLLHWSAANENGTEYLEIVVSSTNLTRAAFIGQLQAVWRACIQLRPQRSEARLRRWGIVPEFLRQLAKSAGDDARLDPFVELLSRTDCPEGVTFVASVPGVHSRQALRRTPWGAAGLREIAPTGRGKVSVSILSPFIGSWSADTLNRWCAAFRGSPDRLELVWIDQNHPWASAGRWLLPKAALNSLTRARATLLHLRYDPDDIENTSLFHQEHRPEDGRWSHAKVYSIRRGNSRRILVTSANFSTAAWGGESKNGDLTIENFELGVCADQGTWPFADLEVFDDESVVATVTKLPSRGTALIAWARATWNGKNVDVGCRCVEDRALGGEIKRKAGHTPITKWTFGTKGFRSARIPWTDTARPPLSVELTCEHETVSVAVFDERSFRDREETIPPGVDETIGHAMRDELLFEQYGGRVAADVESTNNPQTPIGTSSESSETGDSSTEAGLEGEQGESGAGSSDSYAVPAFVSAQRHLRVVDQWADQVMRAVKYRTGEFDRQALRRDGELLVEAFQRQADRDGRKGPSWAIGARLAGEELTLRLKHLPEG
jgi:hypothetical protein